jgi:hypothetical protein
MAAKRRYTQKQKASAVTAAAASSVVAAAEATGIPATTIDYWMHKPEFVAIRDRTREDLAEEMRVLAHKATERLVQLIPTMDARDLTVLASMSTDKSELLTGGATARTETRTLTDGFDDDERQALKDAIDAELARREVEACRMLPMRSSPPNDPPRVQRVRRPPRRGRRPE